MRDDTNDTVECALGMESRDIPDDSVTSSSTASFSSPSNGRLNHDDGGWSAAKSSPECFLQIDLGCLYDVTAVATQGGSETRGDYVLSYKLQFSLNKLDWEFYEDEETDKQVLTGNSNCCTVVRRNLTPYMRARFVRFCPVKWVLWPSMRVEVYGVPISEVKYETCISVSDVYSSDDKGCPNLQFYVQLFGEKGFTRRLPLEITANMAKQQGINTNMEDNPVKYKRKLVTSDVGWVKHIKITYQNGTAITREKGNTIVRRLRRMSIRSRNHEREAAMSPEYGFFVEDIEVDIAQTGQHFTFPCRQWLLQGSSAGNEIISEREELLKETTTDGSKWSNRIFGDRQRQRGCEEIELGAAFDARHRHRSRVASAASNTAITDDDIQHVLLQEEEDTQEDWKPVKAPAGIKSWRREPKKMETTRLTKTTFDLDGIPYEHVIQLMTDWDLRKKWDETFEKVIMLEDDGESKVMYCCLKMPRLYRMWELVLSTMEKRYSGREPCHVTVWCSTEHSSVSEEAKATLKRLHVRLSGLVIRPNGKQSSRLTLLTRMRTHEGTPRPLKHTFLNGRPADWIRQFKDYYIQNGIKKTESSAGNDDVF